MTARFVDPSPPRKPGPFRVGDRVRVPFGDGFVEATIVEDRGNLGYKGMRVYGLCYDMDDLAGENYTEREADQLTLVARAPVPEKKTKKRE